MPFNKMFQESWHTLDAYDCVAELWWDSIDDLMVSGATSEGANAGQILLENEQNFIELSQSCIFFREEHAIVGN
jgi:hypothetical protein